MARVNLLNFNDRPHKGLYIAGSRERTPPSHMRRLTAVHAIRERILRTRNGTEVDATIAAAHSLGRMNDVRFQGATTVLYRNGVSIDTAYDGTPLEFEASNPRTGTAAEYLFVSGGGKLRKVDTTGTVTQWGIDPPSGGNWDAAGGTGETEEETTVIDPQETTIALTNSTSGWSHAATADAGSGTVTLVTAGVLSASGFAVKDTAVQDTGGETEDSD